MLLSDFTKSANEGNAPGGMDFGLSKMNEALNRNNSSASINSSNSIDLTQVSSEPAASKEAGLSDIFSEDQRIKAANDALKIIENPGSMLDWAGTKLKQAVLGNQLSSIDKGQDQNALDLYDPMRDAPSPAQIAVNRAAKVEEVKAAKSYEEAALVPIKPDSYLGKQAQSATASIAMMLPTLPLMIAAPQIAPALVGTMFFSTYGDKYQERILEGDSPEAADKSATWHGVTEVATEMIGLPFLSRVLKAAKTVGVSLPKAVFQDMLAEQVGEFAASNLQGGEDVYHKGGFEAVKQWVGSEDWQRQMVDTAVSTAMVTGAMGAGLSPIKASYQARVTKEVAKLDKIIETMESGQIPTLESHGASVTLEELKKQRSDLASTWEVSEDDVAAHVDALNKSEEALQSENQNLQDIEKQKLAILESLREQFQTKEKEESVDAKSSEERAISERAGQSDVVGEGISGDTIGAGTVEQDGNLPNVQGVREGESGISDGGISGRLGQSTVDVGLPPAADPIQAHHDDIFGSSDIRDNVVSTPAINPGFADTSEKIRAKLGFTGKTVYITSDELSSTDYGRFISGLIPSEKLVGITGGRHITGLVDPKSDKSFSVAILDSKFAKEDLATQVIMGHEAVGHSIYYEFHDKAPELIQQRIASDVDSFFSKASMYDNLSEADKDLLHKEFFDGATLKRFGKSAVENIRQRADEPIEAYKERIKKEYIANQIVKAVYSSKPATTIMQRFWNKIADAYKSLFKSYQDSNADLVTGVKSVRDFIDLLYRNQESVENFNVVAKTPFESLIRSVVNSMLSVEDGKIFVKPTWLMSTSTKLGKTVLGLRKFQLRYLSKEKTFVSASVRPRHAQDSQFKIKKDAEGYKLMGPVPFINHKGFTELKSGLLFSIDKEQFSRLSKIGNLSPDNSAYALMQNIRDILIISSEAVAKPKMKKEFLDGFLQTSEGKAIKVRVPAANRFLKEIYQEAVLQAPERDMSSAQLFLQFMAKDFGGAGSGIRAATGVAIPENDAIYDRLERRIAILERLAPELSSELQKYSAKHSDNLEAPTEKAMLEDANKPEAIVSEQPKERPMAFIEDEIDTLIKNALPKKGKKIDGVKIFDELGWRYINELTDPVLKNYAEAYAKEAIEGLIGESVGVQLKDNVKLAKIASELRELGATVYSSASEQFVDDLVLESEDVRIDNGEGFIEGSYTSYLITEEGNIELPEPGLFVSYIEVNPEQRRKGFGADLYIKALQKYKTVYSGSWLVSSSALKTWDYLERNKYVTKSIIESPGFADLMMAKYKLTDKGVKYKTYSATGAYSVLLSIPSSANDQTSLELYQEMYSDDFALHNKPKGAKRSKIREEGYYAFILNQRTKPDKERVRRKPDPVKVAARKAKLQQFLSEFKTLIQLGEAQGQSIGEYLRANSSFTPKEIRTMIYKYHSNMSMYSQVEIIMRLSHEIGLVENGDMSRLEELIRITWPAVGEELGSDGSIQSLGTEAKDHLIFMLQNIIVKSSGSKFDVNALETVSQRVARLDKAENDLSLWKRSVQLAQRLFMRWADKIGTTPEGKELIFRLNRIGWKSTLYQRDWNLRFLELRRKYKTEADLQRLMDFIHGRSDVATDLDLAVKSLINEVNQTVSRDMELNQIKIHYRNGSWEFYKHSTQAAEDYFPHMWESGDFKDPSDRMIQSLIDAGTAIDRNQALSMIKKQFKRDYIASKKFANMELARESELGGWIEDPFVAYEKYIRESASRLALLEEMGNTPELALAQLALGHFKNSKDSQALKEARDLINEVLGVRIEEPMLKDFRFGVSLASMASVGLLLHHSFIVQTGVANSMGSVAGYGKLIKGMSQIIGEMFKDKSQRDLIIWAKRAGVLNFTMTRELHDIVSDDRLKERTDKIVRAFLIPQVDSGMRLVGGLVGKMYAEDIAMSYAKKQTPRLYEQLREIGLEPERILNRENPGVLTERERRMGALVFTENTNIVSKPTNTPILMRNHPLLRLFFMFQKFTFEQHFQLLKLASNRPERAALGVLGGVTTGAGIMLLRSLLSGDDPEKLVKEEGVAKMLWKALTSSGYAGMFVEAIGNAVFDFLKPGSSMIGKRRGIDTPVFGLGAKLLEGVVTLPKIASGKRLTENEYNNAIEASLLALQTGLIALPDGIGVIPNAVIGMTKPAIIRGVAPTKRQSKTTYIGR